MEPVDKVCHQLPPKEVYQLFGRASKLLIHPKYIPDIKLLIPKKTINRKEDTAEVNEVIIRNKNVDGQQTSSDKSEKSINTVTKQKGEQTTRSEYSKKNTSEMDNSKKLIYRKNLIENSEIDDGVKRGHTKPFTKPSEENEKLLNRSNACVSLPVSPYQGEGDVLGEITQGLSNIPRCESNKNEKSLIRYQPMCALRRTTQDREMQGYTFMTNWTSDKSEKLFNRINQDEIFVTPFRSEKWNHDHEENFTDAAVQDEKQ